MGSMFSRLYNRICDKTHRNESNVVTEGRAQTCVQNQNNTNNTSIETIGRLVANRKNAMDVTKDNFLETLEQLDSVVSECDFMAIDTELSGLRRLDAKSLQLLDTIDERYLKLKQSICGFSLIQFGLTCFKAIEDNDCKYMSNSYNFYIFPQKSSTIGKSMSDRVFSVQTSSLQFLANNGFDFNKLIIDGISYLNDSEEKQCLENIKSLKEIKPTTDVLAITEEDKKFVEEVLKKVQHFIGDQSLKTLDLSPCHGFKRRLIYETLKAQEFNDSIDIKTVTVSQNSIDRYVSISKIDKLVKERKDLEALTEAIGFSKVIQLMIKYQKPVVGHNVCLDLMHTFNQFIEPLPNDYQTFKQSIHALFPIIYDTKHIASSNVFKEILDITALGDLYSRLKKSPFIPPEIELKNGKHIEGKCLHEAGYDSYITGICFVGLVRYLGSKVDPKISRFDTVLMNDFQNKLYLTYSHDIHYLNLESEDVVPNRDHVFHVTFPKEWKTTELFHLFSAFGGVSIGWINDTSAFCALKDPSNTLKIKKSLVKHSQNQTYKVVPYRDFLNKTQTQTQNSSPNEEMARDSIKRNSKARASPQALNPNKKSKFGETNDLNKKGKQSKGNEKLFEEPNEWEVEPN